MIRLLYFLFILILITSCNIFRGTAYLNGETGTFKYENIDSVIMVVDESKPLSPGQNLLFDLVINVKKKNKKYLASELDEYFKRSRNLHVWDYFKYEIENASLLTYQNGRRGLMINENLVFNGYVDTVKVVVRHISNNKIVTTKQIIVDHKGDCLFDFAGQSGRDGKVGIDGSIGDSENPASHIESTNGTDGENGKNGQHINIYVKDTVINDLQLLEIRCVSKQREQYNIVYADSSLGRINVTVAGGNGGNGGKGGDAKDQADYGGRGGNGGNGGMPGSITCYIQKSAMSYLSKFDFDLEPGKPGKSGAGGYSERHKTELEERRKIRAQYTFGKIKNAVELFRGEDAFDNNGQNGNREVVLGNLKIIIVD